MVDEIYLVIESIDLLTRKEASQLPKTITDTYKDNFMYWWLQDAQNFVCVHTFSPYDIFEGKSHFSTARIDVMDSTCPALTIPGLDSLKLTIGQELEIFDLPWLYIGKNKVLSKNSLWEGEFDGESNDYKTSDIKRRLDKWLKEQKAEFIND